MVLFSFFEINWETFIERSKYLGITMFARTKYTKVPKIIYDEFPSSTTLRYNMRHQYNLPRLVTKKNYFYNSYFATMFRKWNSLPLDIKTCNNIEDFEEKLQVNK